MARELEEEGMRRALGVSTALHAGVIGFAILGGWMSADPPEEITLAEVEVIDAAAFEAAVSAAPAEVSDAPENLTEPEVAEAASVEPDATDEAVEAAEAEPLASDAEAPDEPAVRPDLSVMPRTRPVPNEPVRPTIAEVPSLDPVARQAAVPESPPATEPLQPLASREPTLAEEKPSAPPPVEERPAELAEETPETPDEPDAQAETAEAEPEAPLDNAPQQAAIPLARPARLAAAAQASGATPPRAEAEETPEEKVAEAKPKPAPAPEAEPKPKTSAKARPSAPKSASRFSQVITQGEKDGLSLALKRYFNPPGASADRSMFVTIAIALGRDGRIAGRPELVREGGGDPGARGALFQAGRRALYQAATAGEFAKLPAAKYDGWQRINVTFTPDAVGFAS